MLWVGACRPPHLVGHCPFRAVSVSALIPSSSTSPTRRADGRRVARLARRRATGGAVVLRPKDVCAQLAVSASTLRVSRVRGGATRRYRPDRRRCGPRSRTVALIACVCHAERLTGSPHGSEKAGSRMCREERDPLGTGTSRLQPRRPGDHAGLAVHRRRTRIAVLLLALVDRCATLCLTTGRPDFPDLAFVSEKYYVD
jgi:hypothetical protein